MTTAAEDDTTPSVRFKRRKITHTKRARVDEAAPNTAHTPALGAAQASDAPDAVKEEEEQEPNLREILRNRKRPRDRLRDVARRPETTQAELVQVDAPRADQYTSRFVAQTGQVVDSSDAQMAVYVEARLAEQNYRKYGWPIPAHLQQTVAAIAPDLEQPSANPALHAASATVSATDHADHRRTAAGQGMLEEVALPSDKTLTHKDWAPPAEPKVRLGRNGKPIRPRKRRSSSDARRDAAVEAVLREAKIDYFDATPAAPRFAGTDEDMLEQFRNEYLEAAEERQARKPTVSVAKDQPKGPKLGGSRSARAAMRVKEEAAAAAARGSKSGIRVNDGRVLEPWEWRGMQVNDSAWYSK